MPPKPDDKPLKSAYELALEKLRDRDRESGEETKELTAEQKKRIAALRQAAKAKLAEIEILHRKKRTEAAADPAALEQLEERYAIDRRRVESKLESDVVRVRAGREPED
jgi:hypothetical protein